MDLMNWNWNDAGVMNVLWRSPGYRGHMPEDPELDKALDDLQITMDPVKRAELSKQVQQMLLEKMVVVPVQSNWTISALRANVMDYHLDFFGMPLMGDIWLSE
jgi:ABC-type transport system substrate-binding protein